MELHRNAALSLNGRRSLAVAVVCGERTLTEAAEGGQRWRALRRKRVGRYRLESEVGLLDRSSAPHRIPHKTGFELEQLIYQLRRMRFSGPEIAELLSMALSTVSAGAQARGDASTRTPGPRTRGSL